MAAQYASFLITVFYRSNDDDDDEKKEEMIKINVARICLGVSLACVFLAIIFDIWSLQDEGAKAQIGSIVFQVIVLLALITVMVLTQFLRIIKHPQQEQEQEENIIKV